MKLFGLTFQSPIVRYKNTDLQEEVYQAIRESIIEDIINEMKEDHKYNIKLFKTYKEKL
jgi:hypothetical protein